MIGATADKWETQKNETVLLAAMPKLGKTMVATSGPLPMVVVACDLGKLSIPPAQDRSQILVLPYQDLTREMGDQGTTVVKKDVFTRMMRDLYSVAKAVKSGEPLQLEKSEAFPEGLMFPTPRTVVLDGFTRLNQMMVDGRLSMNNLQYTEDLSKEIRFNFWGKRLTDVYAMVQQYASLKLNVVITSWVKAQMTKDGQPTGVWLPDIGGAMDLRTAGVVGSALLCYSRAGKYYVRVQPDGMYPWCGIRDKISTVGEVDVTIDAKNPLPWTKLFGGGV